MSNEPLTESYYYILLCLYKGPNHGYGIMQQTEELTNQRLKIGAGTMYGAFTNLLKKGLITEYNNDKDKDSRKKQYILTRQGIGVLESEVKRLKELVNNADAVITQNKENNDIHFHHLCLNK